MWIRDPRVRPPPGKQDINRGRREIREFQGHIPFKGGDHGCDGEHRAQRRAGGGRQPVDRKGRNGDQLGAGQKKGVHIPLSGG